MSRRKYKKCGPQHDPSPGSTIGPASRRDILRYARDSGSYPIDDYIFADRETHCRGCEFKHSCLAWKDKQTR